MLHKLVAALESAADVRLDGAPIRPRAAPCEWRVRVADDGPGFRLALERHPAVSETLGDDVVRCGDELRVLGASGLDGRDLEALARGRRFAPEEAAELAAEVLPALEKKLPVEVETRAPPGGALRAAAARRRDVARGRRALGARDARLRRPAARAHRRRTPRPARRARSRCATSTAEQRLTAHLRSALGLEPGVRREMPPSEALRFAARLEALPRHRRGRARTRTTSSPAP